MSFKAKVIAAVTMAAVSLAVVSCMNRANADHCRKQNVVSQSTGAVITQFAVPVAVPVQIATPYVYSHAGAQSYTQSLSAEDAQLLEEFKEFKRQRQAVKAAVVPPSLIAQNCNACHTKAGAKSSQDAIDHLNMDLDLTAEQKLAASKSLLKGTMPKGRVIDDKTRGNLLGELLGVDDDK